MTGKISSKFIIVVLTTMLALVGGCATFYQKTQKFQDLINTGEILKAHEWLQDQKKMQKGINRLLYLFNDGWSDWMLGNYDSSNVSLNEADLMIEDQRKNLALEGLSFITNPGITPYQPEDFEIVFVNYFKALNFIGLKKYEDALVECRRMSIRLYELNDKYKERKNRYSDDAFAHVLVGLIYEANKDINNAFIAYRNAWETYRDIYKSNFNLTAPDQLKMDLLRTARQMGFNSELTHYEHEFNMSYEEPPADMGELVFIWQNGFGPVKAEWSVNLAVVKGEGGFVNFTNEELGLNIPFFIGDLSADERSNFSDLTFVRIAFPKYVERTPVFTSGILKSGETEKIMQVAEDINAIAFKTLNDRMMREMGESLLRFAAKRAIEEGVRKENQDIGAAVSIINMLTEKADTRNWQTLPNTISYTRIYLPEGKNLLTFIMSSDNGEQSHHFEVEIQKKQTAFYTFQSLETYPPSN
ncbi:MAG: hypothetical protein K9H16_07190 [Bacteroidales bacterium]|nr:hypothetical protein [Bacteroidales bacterium]